MRNKLSFFCIFFAVWAVPFQQSRGEECEKFEVSQNGASSHIDIGPAWSGTTVEYSAVAHRGQVFIGYFDASRWLTVSRIDLVSGDLCRTHVDSRFSGWDSHNFIRVAIDNDDYVHVAGNMHASPLVYARSDAPLSLEGLERLRPMTGQQELEVTYPLFLIDGASRLLFLYRDGTSGSGAWYVNQFVRGQWKRVSDRPLFADHWRGRAISAYPTVPMIDANGDFHIAIVWRQGSDVEANISLTYVKTRDYLTFSGVSGELFHPPLDPSSGDMVDDSGPGAGLFNNQRIGVDHRSIPVIVYHRYGEGGRNTIFAARPALRGWRRGPIAVGPRALKYEGKGTVPDGPGLTDVVFDGSVARVNVKLPGEASKSVWFNVDSLVPVNEPENFHAPYAPRAALVTTPEGLRQPRQINLPVFCSGREKDAPVAMISYVTQPPNRDQRQECSDDAQNACAPPPSQLVLSVRNRSDAAQRCGD